MQKLTDTMYLIPGKGRGNFPYCNCLYIKDDVCGLIDSAAGKDNLQPLLGRVEVLLNSHFHPDHVRGNGLFPQAHIRCHADDAPALESYEEMLRYTGYDRFTPEQIAKFMPIINHRPSRVDSTFADGEVLDFGRTKLRVIHVPGHTPGHCCFYEEKTGIMFGADIDLSTFGPWYAHEFSDLEAFETSMSKVIDIGPQAIASGHQDGFVDKNVSQRLVDYAQIFAKREQRILKELQKPQSVDDLAKQLLIYPKHPEPQFFYFYFEWQMIRKHLVKLQKRGELQENNGLFNVAI